MDKLNRAIDRFCYRHPRFGIRNLMKYIVVLNLLVYILSMVDTQGRFMQYLYFSPWLIQRGQVWRLITYIFIPTNSKLLFFAISQYFYYFIGTRLESAWGSGRFTIYYVFNVIFTALFSMICWWCTHSITLIGVTADYINMAMFFAFATMYPDAGVLVLFIIPIKMKWLALLAAAYYIYGIIVSFNLFPLNLVPLAALLGYFIFFGPTLIYRLRRTRRPSAPPPINFGQSKSRRSTHSTSFKGGKTRPLYNRKCCVCGRTDTEFPNLEFRYCSKCTGYHCFCMDHINNHVHFTE